MIRSKEKLKFVYFDVDYEVSEWLNTVSLKVGVTKEQLVKESIEAWLKGDIVI